MSTVTQIAESWGCAAIATYWAVWVIRRTSPRRRVERVLSTFPDWIRDQLEQPYVDEPGVAGLESAVAAVLYPCAPPLPLVAAAMHPASGHRFLVHV